NLFAWQNVYNTEYADFEDGVVLRMKINGKYTYLFPLTSREKQFCAVKEILDFSSSDGPFTEFSLLPKDFAERLCSGFGAETVYFNRDYSGYIYEKESLCTFNGHKLHSKKNHLHKFFSLYGNSFSYSGIKSVEDIEECKKFNEKWYSLNEEKESMLAREKEAVLRMLDNFFTLGLIGGMIRISGNLCAYTLASSNYDGSDTVIIHAEKGLYDINGIYPAICSEFLKNSCEKYKFVNREDDLGDEGLRQSKTSYSPVSLEDKYFALLKNKG
nr:phosphatidylglycerol lysyltransferase domain-containing protein [Clostridiales bacterium]